MTNSVRRFSLFTVLLASVSVVGAAALGGQQRSITGPQGGVAVDFLAIGANGQPVADLKAEDVSIKIAGKARTISSLEFMKPSSGSGPMSAVPAPFAVNTAASGRAILILIDNESLRVGTERAVRESLDQVMSQLGPADRVAYSVAPRDTVGLGFSSGVPAVRAALAKFTGIRPASVTDSDNQCRSRDSLQLIRSMMDALAGSDTPTSVLYISSGLALPSTVNRNAGSSLTCEVQAEHYNGIATALANGRVNLYVAQGDESITGRDNGLENLAGVGGAGAVLRAIPNGLNRILTDSAGYYLATVQPDPSDRPGQVQKLEVKVNREGVSTRARADVATTLRRAAGGGKAVTPREMVATTAAFTDLQLRGTAVVSRGLAGKLNVLTLTESVEPGVKLTAASAVIIAPGAAKAAYARTAEDKELAGRPLVLGLAADPGKYRVRVAATDANGRSGALDYDVDASLVQAGPLQLGQMLLLAPRGENFSPQMVFTDEAEAAVVFDLYGPVGTSKLGAKVDIAATIDGPALAEGVLGGSQTNEPDKFTINAKIPIAKLAPGDYIIRATVQVEGQPEGKITRTLRKVAK